MTADPDALLRLATDIEALEGPDREMDARVAEAFGHKIEWRSARYTQEMTPVVSWQTPHPCAGMREQCPRYTDSVDAALHLFEQALPGFGHSLWKGDGNYYPGHNREVSVWRPTSRGREPLGPHIHGSAPTLPLAICAAVLRAVAAREGSDA